MTRITEVTDVYPSRLLDRPEITDRKDPVVYNSKLVQNVINAEQLSSYEKDGFLFLESFLSQEELTQYRKELKEVWKQSTGTQRPEVIKEPGGDEVRSVFAVHKENEVFRQVSTHPRLLAVVEQILGSSVYVHQSRINFKPGYTGKEFYWHSDFETWHVEDGMPRMRALSCSIALEDNYTFNGPLMVVPGSHKHFVSCVGQTPDDHYKNSLRKQEYGVPDPNSLKRLTDQGGIVTPTGKAGSILLFDCNTMHGSNSNITPYPRSNVFIVFNSVENKLQEPFSGLKPRPGFIAARD